MFLRPVGRDARPMRHLAPALALVALVVTAPAASAADWVQPFPLTEPTPGLPQQEPLVAMAPNGDANVVWLEEGPCDVGNCTEEQVKAVRVRSDGQARDIYRLSRSNALAGIPDNAMLPRLAVDGAGRARIAWLRKDTIGDQRVEMAMLDAAGDPTGAAEFVSPPGDAFEFALGMNAAGQGVLVWQDAVELRARRFDASGFGIGETIVQPIAANHDLRGLAVAVDAAGAATIAWSDASLVTPVGTTVQARRLSPVTGLGFTHTLDSWAQAIGDPVALDVHPASGTATLLWSHYPDTGGDVEEVRGARITAADALEPFAFAFDTAGRPDVAVAHDGSAMAVVDMLREPAATTRDIAAARIAPNGTAGSLMFVSDNGTDTLDPQVDVAPDGTAFVGWHEISGAKSVQAARIPAGAGPEDPQTLLVGAPFGASAAVGADDDGNALAVSFTRGAGPERVLQGEFFDAEPPEITTFGLPARGLVGQQLWFGTVARDDLSEVDTPTWTFGDGTGGAAPLLSHAFSRPGAFRVRVRVRDFAGNATTRTGSVAISALPTAGPSGSRAAPPQFSVGTVPSRLRRRALLRRGLAVEVTAATPTAFTVELVGRLRGARLAAAGDVVLAERRLAAAAGTRSARLRVSKATRVLVRRGARLRVRITATGADGGTAAITRRLRVR
jgi:PKD domain